MNSGFDNSIVRHLNNRLVLWNLLQHAPLSKADLTKLTGLTPRTIQLIVNRLSEKELVLELPLKRGRVGQPTTPLMLNKESMYGVGVKVGRRRLTVQNSNFCLEVTHRYDVTYPYYQEEHAIEHAVQLICKIKERLPKGKIKSISCATPNEMASFADKLARRIHQPIKHIIDVHAATLAEQWLATPKWSNYYYFFIGTYVTGAIILDNKIYQGAIASDFAQFLGHRGKSLSDECSLIHLDRYLVKAKEKGVLADGLTGSANLDLTVFSKRAHSIINDWIEEATNALAHAIGQVQYVMNLEGAIIETALPSLLSEKICTQVSKKTKNIAIAKGSIGTSARSYGAAIEPLLSYFQFEDLSKEKKNEYRH